MTQELTPLPPEKAVDLYLAQREEDSSERTVQAHGYRLKHWLRWCDEEGIDNVNDLSGRLLYEYRQWRRKDGDLNTVSLRTQLSTLRKFVRFLEQVDGVEKDLYDKIILPTLDDGEDARDDMLEPERAKELLSYLQRFEYASRPHVLLLILWETSMRMGAVHSLDVDDFDPEDQCLKVRHRPDEGTYLKNKDRGERIVSLKDETCTVIQDWIDHNRPDVTDEYGRKPLIATSHGRISKSNLRAVVYHKTRLARREKTRRGKLSRLFMGLFIFSIFLSTIPQLDVALIPAVVFWILTVYYGFSDMVNEDPLEVHDDQTENQR